MRRKTVFFAAVLATILAVSTSFAAGGTAIIPLISSKPYYTLNSWKTYIHMNNISANEVAIQVKLYRQDGTAVVDDNSGTTGDITATCLSWATSYTEATTASAPTVTFNLPAKKARTITLNPVSGDIYGYGVIGWSNASDDPQADRNCGV